MTSKITLSIIFLFLLSISIHRAQSTYLDITKLGAKADGKTDISTALMGAWKQACGASGLSKVVIPKGTYMIAKAVDMVGPCRGVMEVIIQGTLRAPGFLKGESWVSFTHVTQLTVYGGGVLDGQGQTAWKNNNCASTSNCAATPYNLRLNFVNKGIIKDITSLNSKNYHVNVLGCNDVTFQKFTITAPGNSPNTDGIHIGLSKNVKIMDSKIQTGDDCISIGDGSQNVHITGVHCGPGHGISIGSLGRWPNEQPVSDIYVSNCVLTNTQNGLRIKSWPGLQRGTASHLEFSDIIMENVQNPILIDQHYCPYNKCNSQSSSKVKLSDISFKRITGTSASPVAVQLVCSSGIPCEQVHLADVTLKYVGGGQAKANCKYVSPQITGQFTAIGCRY